MTDFAELMRRAAEAIKNQPYPEACQHLVSANALHRPGIYRCHWCGVPVEIPYPLSERA